MILKYFKIIIFKGIDALQYYLAQALVLMPITYWGHAGGDEATGNYRTWLTSTILKIIQTAWGMKAKFINTFLTNLMKVIIF